MVFSEPSAAFASPATPPAEAFARRSTGKSTRCTSAPRASSFATSVPPAGIATTTRQPCSTMALMLSSICRSEPYTSAEGLAMSIVRAAPPCGVETMYSVCPDRRDEHLDGAPHDHEVADHGP